VREPHNPYDANAVRVENMNRQKVGHIKRQQAAALAPIMDRYNNNGNGNHGHARLKIDGSIPYEGNQWQIPIRIEFFGSDPDLVEDVGTSLARFGYRMANTTFQVVSHKKKTSEVIAASVVTVQKKGLDWKVQQKELDDMFEKQSKESLSNLPEVAFGKLGLTTALFPHQEVGIRWLVHKETGNEPVPFFKQVQEKGQTVWLSEITNSSRTTPPQKVRGGILADDMGLGKVREATGRLSYNKLDGAKSNLLLFN
jgi:SWI/SNF-related matrix-associated actin-dependent regulator of chromatin subfamily A3